jgi:hypothetical protein
MQAISDRPTILGDHPNQSARPRSLLPVLKTVTELHTTAMGFIDTVESFGEGGGELLQLVTRHHQQVIAVHAINARWQHDRQPGCAAALLQQYGRLLSTFVSVAVPDPSEMDGYRRLRHKGVSTGVVEMGLEPHDLVVRFQAEEVTSLIEDWREELNDWLVEDEDRQVVLCLHSFPQTAQEVVENECTRQWLESSLADIEAWTRAQCLTTELLAAEAPRIHRLLLWGQWALQTQTQGAAL